MWNDTRLDIGGWAKGVEGLGPGQRVILWVRGCTLACPGCMTPELWARSESENWRTIPSVAEELLPALRESDCAGLTISGGEPFQQCEALAALIVFLRAQIELEIMVYSGYALEELRENLGLAPLLALVDLLMDGRFQNGNSNDLQWRGSDNQRLHLLSARAQKYAGETEKTMPNERVLGVQMLGAGVYRIVGIPRRGDLRKYRQLMEARGLWVRPDL